ncbi:MAG TPA: type II CAAX endopeptidase family protein [Candidatus Dormibacteraeota bacterium]|nr:type II CAAX endopeptidase family protein [Candidatus Dormibacteraeota bacterium]
MVPALVGAFAVLMVVELVLRATGALGPGGRASSPVTVGGLNFLFDLLIYAAALLVVVYLAVWRPHGSWAALGLRRTAVGPLLLMPPVALAIQFVGGLVSQAVAGALHAGHNPQTCAVRVGFGNEVVLAVLAVGVVAPIAEEIIFRGFIYGALRQKLPWGAAALLSAVVFTAFHAPSVQGYVLVLAPTLLLAGVVLAAVYERTRSLLPGMVLHASFNLIAVAAIFATGLGTHCR